MNLIIFLFGHYGDARCSLKNFMVSQRGDVYEEDFERLVASDESST